MGESIFFPFIITFPVTNFSSMLSQILPSLLNSLPMVVLCKSVPNSIALISTYTTFFRTLRLFLLFYCNIPFLLGGSVEFIGVQEFVVVWYDSACLICSTCCCNILWYLYSTTTAIIITHLCDCCTSLISMYATSKLLRSISVRFSLQQFHFHPLLIHLLNTTFVEHRWHYPNRKTSFLGNCHP